ncbi:MAG: hypothetical protein M1835_003129 [Candelina submexicana]|nr:MAG: hypothetical protein M1835_003129 [Candelina submexicana]
MAIPTLSSILALPPELRNQIYEYAIDWPDMRVPFSRMRKECERIEDHWMASSHPRVSFSKPCVDHLVTPSILLINRQIYHEARAVLIQKTFVLASTPPHSAQLGRPMDITEFIGETTLQKIQHMRFELQLSGHARAWMKTIETLMDVWCHECSLQSLEVKVIGVTVLGERTFGDTDEARHIKGILTRVRDWLSWFLVGYECGVGADV